MLEFVLLVLISYLIGSFPTAIIAGKWIKSIDIREHGSGNAGATNVFRVLGWKAGVIVLLIDMFKGFAPVWWLTPPSINPETHALFQIGIGVAAIAGHIWTVFARFKGGKGVGTAAGVFLGIQPVPVLLCLLSFVIIVAITRYVSLGSMISAILLPVFIMIRIFVFSENVSLLILGLSIVLAGLIVYMHRENIGRLRKGNENKLSFSGIKAEK